VERYPDRLVGGAVIHARLWNDHTARLLETWVRDHNVRMLYIHPSFHKYWLPIQTPSEGEGSRQLLYPIFEAARAMKLPVYIHTGEPPYGLPATVEFVAGQFSDVAMIIGHMGTQGEVHTLEALLVAERHPNVYLETSYTQCHMLIESVHRLGAGRIIFGSNCPPMEPTQQLMVVEESLTYPPPIGMGLAPAQARCILGTNLEQLLAAVRPVAVAA
jgi:predicted TIM-barrel fold metal-dependent hydrolase